jgi:hypothetical protein
MPYSFNYQAMEKSAAVVGDVLGITEGIDLMMDAGKATGEMMKVLISKSSPLLRRLNDVSTSFVRHHMFQQFIFIL